MARKQLTKDEAKKLALDYIRQTENVGDVAIESEKFTEIQKVAGSIMKCNTWRSRKEPVILSVYGKTIPAFEH